MHRLCVFCGSNAGDTAAYREAAVALGRLLAQRRVGLVYGGGHVGLMGLLADAALSAGGRVTGVIPQALWDREVGHTGLSELRVVGSMHERKAVMAELSDAFVALPGGVGTLEEIFEAWTWGQLGIHRKPCGLLNVAGYFDPLLSFLDRAVEAGFVPPAHRAMLQVAAGPAPLLDLLAAYTPPPVRQWLTRLET